MTTTYLGSLSLAAALPGPTAALSHPDLPSFADRVASLAQFAPGAASFELDLASLVVSPMGTLPGFFAAVAGGAQPPSIELQLEIMAAELAKKLALELMQRISDAMASAGVHVYRYSGEAASLGASLDTSEGLLADVEVKSCNAIILATSAGATWSAMSQVFKVTP